MLLFKILPKLYCIEKPDLFWARPIGLVVIIGLSLIDYLNSLDYRKRQALSNDFGKK